MTGLEYKPVIAMQSTTILPGLDEALINTCQKLGLF
jgi:hypothetical protein